PSPTSVTWKPSSVKCSRTSSRMGASSSTTSTRRFGTAAGGGGLSRRRIVSLDGDMLVSAQDILLATFISRSRHIVATFFALNTKSDERSCKRQTSWRRGITYEKIPTADDDDPADHGVARPVPATRSRTGRSDRKSVV